MSALARSVLMVALVAPVDSTGCSNGAWTVAYSPEHCHMEGNAAVVSCNAQSGEQCGTRMSSSFNVGTGLHSMGIKAAAGAGVATTFYLSNNGGLYDKTKQHPWVELDFEIMGHMAGPESKIWTNMFTGIAVEHNQWITVPFDVTSGYHTYSFELSDKSIAWIVDGVTYRKEEITQFEDVQHAVSSSALQEFISVWGKSSSDPGEGIPAFRSGLGVLNENLNKFPLYAGYKRFDRRLQDLSSANEQPAVVHGTGADNATSLHVSLRGAMQSYNGQCCQPGARQLECCNAAAGCCQPYQMPCYQDGSCCTDGKWLDCCNTNSCGARQVLDCCDGSSCGGWFKGVLPVRDVQAGKSC